MWLKQLKLHPPLFFLTYRTIEKIYPYYVKAPSDSNSKPIKQLLSGKDEKELVQNFFKSFYSVSTVCMFSLSQAALQFSFLVRCGLQEA